MKDGEAAAQSRSARHQGYDWLVETLAITVSAFQSATALGFDRGGVVDTILSIERKMFVKSMTTYADHRVWQDVYQVPARDLVLYVKFQAAVVTGFAVVSFKER